MLITRHIARQYRVPLNHRTQLRKKSPFAMLAIR